MNFVPGTFTGLHPDEISLFQKVIGGMEGEAVEIGCMDGFSTAYLLECSKLRVTSIDPFIHDSEEKARFGHQDWLERNVAPWKDRHRLIVDYSWDIALMWNLPLDLVFIDGDHTYLSVATDLKDWMPFIKLGGYLAVHDARAGYPGGPPNWPGPTRAVKELVRERPDIWAVVGEAVSLVIAQKILEGKPDERAGTAC